MLFVLMSCFRHAFLVQEMQYREHFSCASFFVDVFVFFGHFEFCSFGLFTWVKWFHLGKRVLLR